MTSHIPEPLPRVLPFRLLAALLAACVGFSWLMVPRQKELVDRLLKDHQYVRVLAVLQKDAHGSRDTGSLQQLTTSQLALLTELLKLSPREQLRAIFSPQGTMPYDPYVHNIVLAAIQFVDVISPDEASEVILPHLDRVPTNFRAELLGTIARNAYAVNQPRVAALALEKACRSEDADWQMAKSMVQSFQWSGHPDQGAAELNEWLKRRHAALTPEQLQAARTLQFQVSLASGHPEWAFDAALSALQDQSSQDQSREWMKRALDAGLQSSRTKELIPFVRLFLSTFPQSRLDLASLQKAADSKDPAFEEYRQWLLRLADWSDWESQFDIAFAAHVRLAAMGNVASLDRCLDLNESVGREEEMAQLLELIGSQTGRDNLQLPLAKLLANIGEDQKACRIFEQLLQKHPENREVLYDYACLREDMGDNAGCRRAFENLLVRHPLDAPATRRLVDVCIRQKDYPRALQLLEQLPPNSHDHRTLESYTMLAESLDNQAARFRALVIEASMEKKPNAEVYLDIADAASYLPDQQPAIDALNQGLGRMPRSVAIRIALANCYEDAGRPDDALLALMCDDTKDNFEAVQVMLSMTAELSDPTKLLDFLGDGVENRFNLSAHQRLDLAFLNQKAGRQAACDRLWASVKEEPKNFKMLADFRFQMANYADALRLQNAHLQSHPAAPASDWVLLGDIYEQLNRFEDAKKAYDHSLNLLTADLQGTASN